VTHRRKRSITNKGAQICAPFSSLKNRPVRRSERGTLYVFFIGPAAPKANCGMCDASAGQGGKNQCCK
jgi:hypothetical protein